MRPRSPVHRFAFLLACACAAALLLPTTRLSAEAMPQTPATRSGLDALPAEQRGDILMARQQYVAAIEAYREAPQDAEVYNKIGTAWHHMLAFDIAKKDYQHALLIRPNYPEAINNLGAADFAQGRYRQAIRLYRRALKLMPGSAVVAANLGTAYFARRNYTRGMQAYREAFRLDPSVFQSQDSQIISGPTTTAERAQQDFCLAELFAQSGMRARAIEYLRKAFDEGFTDRNRVLTDHVFDQLRSTAEFAQLMGEQKLR